MSPALIVAQPGGEQASVPSTSAGTGATARDAGTLGRGCGSRGKDRAAAGGSRKNDVGTVHTPKDAWDQN